MLPVPNASAWTAARCASACVPCNAGAQPGRAVAWPAWSRKQRVRTTTSGAAEGLVNLLHTEKPHARASVPELVRRAGERGIIPVDVRIHRTTVWRACRRMGPPTRRRPHKRGVDTRRWRYAERMQCVLADGKHFRAGAARLRRVALFFLDDATRYAVEVLVGTAESSELFLRALHQNGHAARSR